ncbi:unnamed protein product [Closterium sp. Naga37s-1]|nr:unnamed protein product [Closterium sp. Naga37s-1]
MCPSPSKPPSNAATSRPITSDKSSTLTSNRCNRKPMPSSLSCTFCSRALCFSAPPPPGSKGMQGLMRGSKGRLTAHWGLAAFSLRGGSKELQGLMRGSKGRLTAHWGLAALILRSSRWRGRCRGVQRVKGSSSLAARLQGAAGADERVEGEAGGPLGTRCFQPAGEHRPGLMSGSKGRLAAHWGLAAFNLQESTGLQGAAGADERVEGEAGGPLGTRCFQPAGEHRVRERRWKEEHCTLCFSAPPPPGSKGQPGLMSGSKGRLAAHWGLAAFNLQESTGLQGAAGADERVEGEAGGPLGTRCFQPAGEHRVRERRWKEEHCTLCFSAPPPPGSKGQPGLMSGSKGRLAAHWGLAAFNLQESTGLQGAAGPDERVEGEAGGPLGTRCFQPAGEHRVRERRWKEEHCTLCFSAPPPPGSKGQPGLMSGSKGRLAAHWGLAAFNLQESTGLQGAAGADERVEGEAGGPLGTRCFQPAGEHRVRERRWKEEHCTLCFSAPPPPGSKGQPGLMSGSKGRLAAHWGLAAFNLQESTGLQGAAGADERVEGEAGGPLGTRCFQPAGEHRVRERRWKEEHCTLCFSAPPPPGSKGQPGLMSGSKGRLAAHWGLAAFNLQESTGLQGAAGADERVEGEAGGPLGTRCFQPAGEHRVRERRWKEEHCTLCFSAPPPPGSKGQPGLMSGSKGRLAAHWGLAAFNLQESTGLQGAAGADERVEGEAGGPLGTRCFQLAGEHRVRERRWKEEHCTLCFSAPPPPGSKGQPGLMSGSKGRLAAHWGLAAFNLQESTGLQGAAGADERVEGEAGGPLGTRCFQPAGEHRVRERRWKEEHCTLCFSAPPPPGSKGQPGLMSGSKGRLAAHWGLAAFNLQESTGLQGAAGPDERVEGEAGGPLGTRCFQPAGEHRVRERRWKEEHCTLCFSAPPPPGSKGQPGLMSGSKGRLAAHWGLAAFNLQESTGLQGAAGADERVEGEAGGPLGTRCFQPAGEHRVRERRWKEEHCTLCFSAPPPPGSKGQPGLMSGSKGRLAAHWGLAAFNLQESTGLQGAAGADERVEGEAGGPLGTRCFQPAGEHRVRERRWKEEHCTLCFSAPPPPGSKGQPGLMSGSKGRLAAHWGLAAFNLQESTGLQGAAGADERVEGEAGGPLGTRCFQPAGEHRVRERRWKEEHCTLCFSAPPPPGSKGQPGLMSGSKGRLAAHWGLAAFNLQESTGLQGAAGADERVEGEAGGPLGTRCFQPAGEHRVRERRWKEEHCTLCFSAPPPPGSKGQPGLMSGSKGRLAAHWGLAAFNLQESTGLQGAAGADERVEGEAGGPLGTRCFQPAGEHRVRERRWKEEHCTLCFSAPPPPGSKGQPGLMSGSKGRLAAHWGLAAFNLQESTGLQGAAGADERVEGEAGGPLGTRCFQPEMWCMGHGKEVGRELRGGVQSQAHAIQPILHLLQPRPLLLRTPPSRLQGTVGADERVEGEAHGPLGTRCFKPERWCIQQGVKGEYGGSRLQGLMSGSKGRLTAHWGLAAFSLRLQGVAGADERVEGEGDGPLGTRCLQPERQQVEREMQRGCREVKGSNPPLYRLQGEAWADGRVEGEAHCPLGTRRLEPEGDGVEEVTHSLRLATQSHSPLFHPHHCLGPAVCFLLLSQQPHCLYVSPVTHFARSPMGLVNPCYLWGYEGGKGQQGLTSGSKGRLTAHWQLIAFSLRGGASSKGYAHLALTATTARDLLRI